MKKRWRVLLKVLGVIVALLIVVCVLHRAYWQAKFNRRVAELKADGQLLTFEDLDAHDSLPEGVPNAADIYLQAFSHYQKPDEALLPFLPIQGSYAMPEKFALLPNEILDAIAKTLKANEQTLILLDQGATIQDCFFSGEQPRHIHNQRLLNDIKRCGELLSEQNLYLAQTNQTDKYVAAMPTLLKLSESPIRGGMLLDEMFPTSFKKRAVESLEFAMNQTQFVDFQLAFLQRQFFKAQDLEACYRGFAKERIYYLECVLSF